MKACVGDRIVIVSAKLDMPVRDGRIVQVLHADGSPPYLVEWGDNQQGLMFPGPDAHLVPGEQSEAAPAAEEQQQPPPRHVRSWQIRVDLFESSDETSAHAVLVTEAPTPMDGRGIARRKAGDQDVPEIGDEIAAARALRRLADQLLGTAADDISAIEGRPISLPS